MRLLTGKRKKERKKEREKERKRERKRDKQKGKKKGRVIQKLPMYLLFFKVCIIFQRDVRKALLSHFKSKKS